MQKNLEKAITLHKKFSWMIDSFEQIKEAYSKVVYDNDFHWTKESELVCIMFDSITKMSDEDSLDFLKFVFNKEDITEFEVSYTLAKTGKENLVKFVISKPSDKALCIHRTMKLGDKIKEKSIEITPHNVASEIMCFF